jgi:hypothetical protein
LLRSMTRTLRPSRAVDRAGGQASKAGAITTTS